MPAAGGPVKHQMKLHILFLLVLVAAALGIFFLPASRSGGALSRGICRMEVSLGRAWEECVDDPGGQSWRSAQVPTPCDHAMRRSRVFYRRRFFLPAEWRARFPQAMLRLEAVTCTAAVTVNGKSVGRVELPDVPAEVDVTKALRWGGENTLVIEVRDFRDLPQYREFTGGGREKAWGIFTYWFFARLSGPVSLVLTSPVRVKSAVAYPSFRSRTLKVKFAVENKTGDDMPVKVSCRVLRDGRQVLDVGRAQLTAGAGVVTAGELAVEWRNAPPWGSFDTGRPQLFRLVVSLEGPTGGLDRVTREFGFREAWVDKGRLVLNGRPYGFWAHRWEPLDGAPPDGGELLLGIQKHGMNSLHPHYGHLPDDIYARADELGFTVVPELQCGGKWGPVYRGIPPGALQAFFTDIFRTWMEAVGNHPSVIVWCQEDLGSPHARAALQETIGADDTRPAMYRDLNPLCYDRVLHGADFPAIFQDPRAAFIQEFHESDPDVVPLEVRELFLARLDGGLFHAGLSRSPLVQELFAAKLKRILRGTLALRSRVLVKSPLSMHGRWLVVTSGEEPGVARAFLEEESTCLGILKPGVYRIARVPGAEREIHIPATEVKVDDARIPPVLVDVP